MDFMSTRSGNRLTTSSLTASSLTGTSRTPASSRFRCCPLSHADFDSLTVLAQDVVDGLDSVLFNDLMSNLSWLFSIHDKDLDGYLTKDEVLQLSEALLVSLPTSKLSPSPLLKGDPSLQYIFRNEVRHEETVKAFPLTTFISVTAWRSIPR